MPAGLDVHVMAYIQTVHAFIIIGTVKGIVHPKSFPMRTFQQFKTRSKIFFMFFSK